MAVKRQRKAVEYPRSCSERSTNGRELALWKKHHFRGIRDAKSPDSSPAASIAAADGGTSYAERHGHMKHGHS